MTDLNLYSSSKVHLVQLVKALRSSMETKDFLISKLEEALKNKTNDLDDVNYVEVFDLTGTIISRIPIYCKLNIRDKIKFRPQPGFLNDAWLNELKTSNLEVEIFDEVVEISKYGSCHVYKGDLILKGDAKSYLATCSIKSKISQQ